jgi:hypothetical protein
MPNLFKHLNAVLHQADPSPSPAEERHLNSEIGQFGEYCSLRLVLEAWDGCMTHD